MKTIIKHISRIVIVSTFLLFTNNIFAEGPDAPPPPGSHGEDTDQDAGGGAPLKGGVSILIVLASLYAGKKIYDNRKSTKEDILE